MFNDSIVALNYGATSERSDVPLVSSYEFDTTTSPVVEGLNIEEHNPAKATRLASSHVSPPSAAIAVQCSKCRRPTPAKHVCLSTG